MQTSEVTNPGEARINEGQAAEALGISKYMLQELCRAGELPFGRLGRKRYFYRSQLESWLRERVRPAAKAGRG